MSATVDILVRSGADGRLVVRKVPVRFDDKSDEAERMHQARRGYGLRFSERATGLVLVVEDPGMWNHRHVFLSWLAAISIYTTRFLVLHPGVSLADPALPGALLEWALAAAPCKPVLVVEDIDLRAGVRASGAEQHAALLSMTGGWLADMLGIVVIATSTQWKQDRIDPAFRESGRLIELIDLHAR